MRERKQISEEQMDEALNALQTLWKQELVSSDIIPANMHMESAHEIAGVLYQRHFEVQAALRIGDRDRLQQAIMMMALAACHAHVSMQSMENVDF